MKHMSRYEEKAHLSKGDGLFFMKEREHIGRERKEKIIGKESHTYLVLLSLHENRF